MELLDAIREWSTVGVLTAAFIYGLSNKLFKRKKTTTIDKEVKFSAPIYDILVDLLLHYPATRTFIKQFHNGDQFYSGQSIQRLTMSHEKCRPGVTPLKPYHDNIQTPVEVHDVFKDMGYHARDWYWCDDADIILEISPELYQWMKSHGVISILYLRLNDKRTGAPIGLLGMTFNHKFRLDVISDILDIKKRKSQIESEFTKL